nr:hypothetical protein K-LCC10_0035 [Kaumoebavirus]
MSAYKSNNSYLHVLGHINHQIRQVAIASGCYLYGISALAAQIGHFTTTFWIAGASSLAILEFQKTMSKHGFIYQETNGDFYIYKHFSSMTETYSIYFKEGDIDVCDYKLNVLRYIYGKSCTYVPNTAMPLEELEANADIHNRRIHSVCDPKEDINSELTLIYEHIIQNHTWNVQHGNRSVQLVKKPGKNGNAKPRNNNVQEFSDADDSEYEADVQTPPKSNQPTSQPAAPLAAYQPPQNVNQANLLGNNPFGGPQHPAAAKQLPRMAANPVGGKTVSPLNPATLTKAAPTESKFWI